MRARGLLVGLFGVAFHVVVAGVIAWVGHSNRANISAGFYLRTVPALLVAAFVIYVLAVAPYVARRPGAKRGVVFLDCTIAMLAEMATLLLTSILHGAIVAALASAAGGASFGAVFSTEATFGALWAFANFSTQVLIVGNVAGIVGWWVLKRLEGRASSGGSAPPPQPPQA